ncbi:MAG: type IV pilus secretin PilQ [Deltaproteobacteria bacterium]|nr:type IV pilus secretin PilQ [Deltaproteobacteria bacterium]
MRLHRDGTFRSRFGLWLFLLGLLAFGCSTPSTTRVKDDQGGKGVLSSIETVATPEKTTIIINAPGARTARKTYTLSDPPRICVDFEATPVDDLPKIVELTEGPVEKCLIQDRGPGHTGVVVVVRPEEYKYHLTREGDEVRLLVTPVGDEKFEAAKVIQTRPGDAARSGINELAVLERPDGGTQLHIKTDQPVESAVTFEGNVLSINLKDVAAAPRELKALEATPSGGVIQGIRAFYAPRDRSVLLKVSLRTLMPYHVSREGTLLLVDFDALPGGFSQPVPPPTVQAQSSRSKTTETVKPHQMRPETSSSPHDAAKASKQEQTRAELFESSSKSYAGQKMSFDFVDTDIRNILKLLAEVANLNIVWGSDVEGKISMRLNNVAWDQALEMVLKPNGLTYQIEDEVLWVVPRSKLVDMEIAEKKRKGALMAAKRLQGIFEAKVVEFIIVRHRPVADIFKMLVGDPDAKPKIPGILDIEGAKSEEKEEGEEEEGKKIKIVALDLYLSYDSGTNMVIANGVRAKVDKVKELVRKLDVPEKQVLIEARIVEATTDFARDLGIQWQSLDGDRPGVRRKWFNSDGTTRFDGSFSTNKPASWVANIGLAFGWLTDGGLGSLALDASLALAQNDQKAKIISSPKVMTKNGGEAFISRGDIDYYSVRTLDTISFQEIPAVLSLKVTPTVSADNSHVTMVVEVTDDKTKEKQITETGNGDVYESPPGRITKKITSTLIVKTGDTVVIGGIYQKEEQTLDSGIPFLKDIPFLGYFFKAEREEAAKRELLIFLTPTVVNSVIENRS